MVLTIMAPVIVAAGGQHPAVGLPAREGAPMAHEHLFVDLGQTDALDARRRPGEVFVDQFLAETERLEDLRAAVALHGRDAHLGEGLDHTLDRCLDVLITRLGIFDVGQRPLPDHVRQRLVGQVGIDGRGAVADQQREVMHLARLARLDDQRGLGALFLADQDSGADRMSPAAPESAHRWG